VNGKAPGLTCCRSADLKSGTLSERIDYILHRGGFDPVSAEVVGTDAMSRTPGNRWASDHAGVVATLEVPAT
jgi:endonuclease/exonuclease/phosphatase family metal-dependent hydrolase